MLQYADFDVDVGDGTAVPDVAEMVDGEQTVVLVSGIMDEGYEAFHVSGIGKFGGCERDGLEGVVCVVEFPRELLIHGRRWSEAESEDANDVLHHFLLGFGNLGR